MNAPNLLKIVGASALVFVMIGCVCRKPIVAGGAAVSPPRPCDEIKVCVQAVQTMDTQALQDNINLLKASLSKAPVIDSTSIIAHYGAIRGGTQTTNQLGISVMGPSVPQNVLTNTSNPTSTNTTQAVTGTSPSNTQTQVTGTSNTQQSVQTNAAVTPAAPTLPTAPTQTLPAGSSSASNILDEQVQLSYQIAGLEMLLTGALSDRYVRTSDHSLFPKEILTIGLPVSVGIPTDPHCKNKPDCRLKNAVAVLTARVSPNTQGCKPNDKSSVSVLQVIPTEKSYNTVSLKNSSTSVGAGGIIGGVVSVGGSFLHSKQTYYLLKQQDTLVTIGPTDPTICNAVTTIEWQFRPLAGEDYVLDGPRTVYAEIAFPAIDVGQAIGKITYSTSWHTFDRVSGAVGPVISGFQATDTSADLYAYASTAEATSISICAAQNAQAVTHIDGVFTPGTQVRLGTSIFSEGTNLIRSDKELEFSAPIGDLMAYTPVFLKRNGTESEITLTGTNGSGSSTEELDADAAKLALDDVWYEPQTNSAHRVTVFATETAVDPAPGKCDHPIFPESPFVVQIGTGVYGLDPQNTQYQLGSVSSCKRTVTLSFPVQDSDLAPGAVIRVRRLYAGSDYDLKYQLSLYNAPIEPVVASPAVNLLSHDKKTVVFAIQGRDIVPSSILNTVVTPKNVLSQHKNVVVYSVDRTIYDSLDTLLIRTPTGEVLTLAVPALPQSSSPSPKKPAKKG